jgi:hypothetical protein
MALPLAPPEATEAGVEVLTVEAEEMEELPSRARAVSPAASCSTSMVAVSVVKPE